MSGSFRIDKDRLAVAIHGLDGTVLRGAIEAPLAHATHPGHQLAAALQSARRFIPFFHGESPAPTLLALAHVEQIVVERAAPTEDPSDTDALLARPRALRLRLASGAVVEGTIRIAKPAGHDRSLDVLDEAGEFLELDTATATHLLRVAAIITADEL
jgi:hypothetical protein